MRKKFMKSENNMLDQDIKQVSSVATFITSLCQHASDVCANNPIFSTRKPAVPLAFVHNSTTRNGPDQKNKPGTSCQV